MTPNERRLASDLLRAAAEEFANYGCNDFKRPEWFPRAEWDAMILEYHTENGDPEAAGSSDYGTDFVLMHHLANKLESSDAHE